MSSLKEKLLLEQTEALQEDIETLAAFTRTQEYAEMEIGKRAVLVEQLGLEFQLLSVLMRRLSGLIESKPTKVHLKDHDEQPHL